MAERLGVLGRRFLLLFMLLLDEAARRAGQDEHVGLMASCLALSLRQDAAALAARCLCVALPA
eukprot:4323633-Lingulodinium_polyedra.AAC.1